MAVRDAAAAVIVGHAVHPMHAVVALSPTSSAQQRPEHSSRWTAELESVQVLVPGKDCTRLLVISRISPKCAALAQEAKRKGPKDEADGLARRLQRINEALDEANKKAVNARSAAESAQKEADGLRPKYDQLKVSSTSTCSTHGCHTRAVACNCHQKRAIACGVIEEMPSRQA